MPEETPINEVPGLIATVCTTGLVMPEFAAHLSELRSWNDRNGYHKVEYVTFDAKLVEAGRDAAVQHAINAGYAWVLQIDADAAPFPANALAVMLETAFVSHPHADAIGAYCQLKSPLALPTIDTGTGTWEEHYPGEGVLPVIRTGGHFLFCKMSAFHKVGGPPWFRTKVSGRPIEALGTVDNFARCELDGKNPFRGRDWEALVACAKEVSANPEGQIGEDSGFCDRLMAAGGSIYVDTRLVAGHMGKQYITPNDLKEAMELQELNARKICGVLE